MPRSADDAALVLAVRGGDHAAFAALFERWSDRCYDVARRIVHDDGAAAEVAQDALLAAWRQLDSLQDPAAFGGWVLRIARNRALDRLAATQRRSTSSLDDGTVPEQVADDDVEAAVTAADHGDVVWAASAVLGERDASVLSLHLRHGLGAAEIGEELGVTTNNAHQLLFRMKKRLAVGVQAWVLFKGGRPSCERLQADLADAAVTGFSTHAAEVIGDHVAACDACDQRRAAALAPEALFAAAPVLVLAPTAKAAMAEALRAQGVPLAGPEVAAGGSDGHIGGGGTGSVGGPGPGRSGTDLDDPSGTARLARRRRALAVSAVAVVLLLVAAWFATSGSDAEGTGDEVATGPSTTTSSADEVTATSTVAAPAPTGAPSTTVADEPPSTFSSQRPTTTSAASPPVADTAAPPAPAPSTFTTDPPAATTTTRPPAPTIQAFTAAGSPNPDGPCPIGQWATTFTWATTNATSVRITAVGETTQSNLPPDGQRIVCRPGPTPPNSGWTLTATGPGGTASRLT